MLNGDIAMKTTSLRIRVRFAEGLNACAFTLPVLATKSLTPPLVTAATAPNPPVAQIATGNEPNRQRSSLTNQTPIPERQYVSFAG
jgi:hypothetical protein